MKPFIRRMMPPLNALKAFESAARHESFTRAAEELSISQAAISHQIRALEEWLEAPLFRRGARAVELTPSGRLYAETLTKGFNLFAEGTRACLQNQSSTVLTVSVLSSIALLWLLPRIERFRKACPEIRVRVVSMDHFSDFLGDSVDVEIRYGDGNWPDLQVARIRGEDIFPVCSPALLKSGPPLVTPEDLNNHNLVHDVMVMDWQQWLEAAGLGEVDVDTQVGVEFNRSNLVVSAAIAGAGVALGRGALVEDALAKGELVRPFDISVTSPFSYYLVYPEAYKARHNVKCFAQWVLGETGA